MSSSYTNNMCTKLGELSLETDDRSREHGSVLSRSVAKAQDERGIPVQTRAGHEGEDLTDEHPEPELLATSVGRGIDGRLIPSSSTISLLSLNANNLSSIGQLPHLVDRRNSHGPPSRTSLTHLHHQRLHPYHKLTSAGQEPTPSIHMARSSGMISAPDSPNLDPTSLGTSPSRFWLGSQTPPKSLSGSYKRNGLHGHNGQYNTRRINRGDESPTLPPVQTPMEDLPMTPLHLSSEVDSYFVYGQKREVFQYDEDQDNSSEQEDSAPMAD